MFIIVGATGHVGSATAAALLAEGRPVTVVTRSEARGEEWRARGASVAVADVRDVAAMRAVFRGGRRLFLLNPPADPSTDTDRVERETIRCLLDALDGSGAEKVVAESTYGAQPGERIGDLGTLYDLERGLAAQKVASSIIRAAYYMSNWDGMLETVRAEGVLPTFFPPDLKIPMVAPEDLGRVAARLLAEPAERTGIVHVEGPERYSASDVAAAFARATGRAVEAAEAPREAWQETFRSLGFSDAAARSYAGMVGITVDGAYDVPAEPLRGTVTLGAYIEALVSGPARRPG